MKTVNKYDKEIGTIIKFKRIEKGLKQSDLCVFEFMEQGPISSIDAGKLKIPVGYIKPICEKLDLNPRVIINLKVKSYEYYLLSNV